MIFSTAWEVHYNSNRTGVRLVGPKPKWARKDGGEAGLHPSNIHDNAYAIGALDFTGDMPILLGPDGPSLGGFVCPAVVIEPERWKLGQLKAGDTVRFERLTVEEAAVFAKIQDETLAGPRRPLDPKSSRPNPSSPPRSTRPSFIVSTRPRSGPSSPTAGTGDRYLLVEYGPLVLDLDLRFRVHALMQWLEARQTPGIIDLTPGIRSLQVHFDGRELTERRLLDLLVSAEDDLPPIDEMEVPTRIIHLPLSWEDEATLETIRNTCSPSVRMRHGARATSSLSDASMASNPSTTCAVSSSTQLTW